MTDRAICKALVALRERRSLSISEAARLIGVHRVTVTRWESGELRPTIDNLRMCAAVYGVSAGSILDGDI
jgi:transcriptional regulator with XRE-family HTH domain